MNTNVKNQAPRNAVAASIAIDQEARVISNQQNNFVAGLEKDKKDWVDCVIPTIYAQYQPSFVISINGATIKIKADGKAHRIPRIYADEAFARMRHIDEKVAAMRAGSDIQEISRV